MNRGTMVMFPKVYAKNTESPTLLVVDQPWYDGHVPESLHTEMIEETDLECCGTTKILSQ